MKQVGSVKLDDALLEKAMGAKAEGQTYTGKFRCCQIIYERG